MSEENSDELLIERFQHHIEIINSYQGKQINKETQKIIRESFSELDSLVVPLTKSIGMKDEQKYHALKAQFAELLNEYQFLKRQYEANFENECLEVKKQALIGACEAAEMIIRVDMTFTAPARKRQDESERPC